MGYRSDIQFTCLRRDYNALVDAYGRHYDGDYPLVSATKSPEILEIFDEEKGDAATIHFGWSGVKWYENDFPDVIAFKRAFEEIFDDDYTHPYTRVRCGEDFDDVESDFCDPDGLLSMHVSPETSISLW